MAGPLPFVAVCREPGCLWHEAPPRFAEYWYRAQRVGEHRVTTGHTVDMYEET